MKRTLAIVASTILCLSLNLLSPLMAYASIENITKTEDVTIISRTQARVYNDGAELYRTPNGLLHVLFTKNTIVTIISTQNAWVEVRIESGTFTGYTGWIKNTDLY